MLRACSKDGAELGIAQHPLPPGLDGRFLHRCSWVGLDDVPLDAPVQEGFDGRRHAIRLHRAGMLGDVVEEIQDIALADGLDELGADPRPDAQPENPLRLYPASRVPLGVLLDVVGRDPVDRVGLDGLRLLLGGALDVLLLSGGILAVLHRPQDRFRLFLASFRLAADHRPSVSLQDLPSAL